MTLQTARRILSENYEEMPLEKLQKHRVRLIDALYHADGTFGMARGVSEGFFKVVESDSASGYVPADMWLAYNLNYILEKVREREALLLGVGMNQYFRE